MSCYCNPNICYKVTNVWVAGLTTWLDDAAQAAFSESDLLTLSSCAVKMGANEAVPGRDGDLTNVVTLQRISHVGIQSLLWKLTMTHSWMKLGRVNLLKIFWFNTGAALKELLLFHRKCLCLMFYHALKRNKQLKLLCEHFRQCSSDQNVGMIPALRAVYYDSYSVYKTLQRPVQLVRSLSNRCSSGGPQSEVRKCV